MLKELNTIGTIYSYADDTVLLFSYETWNFVKNKAKTGLGLKTG